MREFNVSLAVSADEEVTAADIVRSDLLRARVGETATGRIFHATGKSSFTNDPVKYDMFMRAFEGLKALEFVGHHKGQTRYRRTGFSEKHSVALPGRAARFWATPKLVKLAGTFGIHEGNVGDHFKPELPSNPLVLRDYGSGLGRNRERGPIIKDYQRTEHTKQLEADIRELNEFLARFKFTGGEHHGYTRNFNLAAWNKGGRLYSSGEDDYQQKHDTERHQMRINGEPVAEIDIKASHLTIYHARLGVPLERSSDPYERAGVNRTAAKAWCLATFGNTNPATRWPPDMVERQLRKTGVDLRKLAKAKDVARKMLAAFPALQKLENYSDIWADLQFIESEAVIGTMLILMRTHGIPSLSMHDGIIVPRSKAELAKAVLAKQYREVVGVEAMLTVEPHENSARGEDL
jgi:hypothetical protein